MILRYYETMILCYYATTLLRYYATTLHATTLLRYYATTLLRYYATTQLWYYNTANNPNLNLNLYQLKYNKNPNNKLMYHKSKKFKQKLTVNSLRHAI